MQSADSNLAYVMCLQNYPNINYGTFKHFGLFTYQAAYSYFLPLPYGKADSWASRLVINMCNLMLQLASLVVLP